MKYEGFGESITRFIMVTISVYIISGVLGGIEYAASWRPMVGAIIAFLGLIISDKISEKIYKIRK